MLDVHLKGAFYVTQPAWKIMREKGYGRIVNTASNSGMLGNFGQANYGAAKMGLVGLTRVLAIEGAKHNIKVNAIAPVARTRMTEELLGAARRRSSMPEAMVTPSWPASCHEECPVTGEVYSVAGGQVSPLLHRPAPPATTRPTSPSRTSATTGTQIRDEEGYTVPASTSDELKKLLELLTS